MIKGIRTVLAGDVMSNLLKRLIEQRSLLTISGNPWPLVEPLANSELNILDLLAQRLRNKEIAEKLFVSPETVKTQLTPSQSLLPVRHTASASSNFFCRIKSGTWFDKSSNKISFSQYGRTKCPRYLRFFGD